MLSSQPANLNMVKTPIFSRSENFWFIGQTWSAACFRKVLWENRHAHSFIYYPLLLLCFFIFSL